jgi:NAD-dependent dihydropyrimidine dehydrogenase PreA subunit
MYDIEYAGSRVSVLHNHCKTDGICMWVCPAFVAAVGADKVAQIKALKNEVNAITAKNLFFKKLAVGLV